jgi:hypothetical protein
MYAYRNTITAGGAGMSLLQFQRQFHLQARQLMLNQDMNAGRHGPLRKRLAVQPRLTRLRCTVSTRCPAHAAQADISPIGVCVVVAASRRSWMCWGNGIGAARERRADEQMMVAWR